MEERIVNRRAHHLFAGFAPALSPFVQVPSIVADE
jgi:hypothetical protein